jgi:excisionase family DNA binding protein
MPQNSAAETEPPLAFQVKSFCRRVGISPATLYKYVALGKIRIVKIGGRTLVPAVEVERLLGEGACPGAPTGAQEQRPRPASSIARGRTSRSEGEPSR